MATTKTSIANGALSIIQDSPITSIDEDTDRARSCKTFFQPAYEITLSEHPWKWATQRKILPRDTGTPEFGYKYQFRLPSDFVRVFIIKKNGVEIEDWDTEEDMLLCDVDGPLQVEMTVAKKNISRMPAWLAEIVEAKLAEKVSSPLKKESTDFERAVALYGKRLASGKKKNAVSQKKKPVSQSSGFEKAMKGQG